MRGLIAHGVPVNTVANSEDIRTLIANKAASLLGSILIVPVLPERYGLTEFLVQYAQAGWTRHLLWSRWINPPALRELLQVQLAEPLEGDFAFNVRF